MHEPVAEKAVKSKDEIFLIGGDTATFYRRPEIVHPP